MNLTRHLRRSARRGFTLVELFMVMVVLGLLAAMLLPRYIIARDKGSYTACSENLKNIAVGVQTFANDNKQVYPTSLTQLQPTYLSTMPTCPNAHSDTYTPSYEKSDLPACFTVYCLGGNHLNIVPVNNQPYYIFGIGLGP